MSTINYARSNNNGTTARIKMMSQKMVDGKQAEKVFEQISTAITT